MAIDKDSELNLWFVAEVGLALLSHLGYAAIAATLASYAAFLQWGLSPIGGRLYFEFGLGLEFSAHATAQGVTCFLFGFCATK